MTDAEKGMKIGSGDVLIEKVASLCPQCNKQIPSMIVSRNEKIFQISFCSVHGAFESMIFSNAELYARLDSWNQLVFSAPPSDGNIFEDSRAWISSNNSPTLGVIDITNVCNYNCPLCFAAGEEGPRSYYLGLETIRKMLAALLSASPAPCRNVQFSGGEPTFHPEFSKILKIAKEMGFSHIQVATNGSRFVDKEFVSICEEMGLHTLYLQFDGMDDNVYLKLRGKPLLKTKMQVVENIARTNMRIVFVPTIAASVNVDQIGPIFRYALKYSKHITGISIQPAAHVGRVQVEESNGHRFNLADMAIEFGKQTGLTQFPEDWFPVTAISRITLGLEKLRGEPLPQPACDAHCSLGTYFYIDENDNPTCLNRFFDMETFFRRIGDLSPRGKRNFLFEKIYRIKELQSLADCFHKSKAPEGLNFYRLLRGLDGWEDKSLGRGADWSEKGYNGLFVAGMHFMDSGNYNQRRLKRCIVQYVTTEGHLIPFCSYNAGLRCRSAEESNRQNTAQKDMEAHSGTSKLSSVHS